MSEKNDQLCEVPIDRILVNPYQPRREFKHEELEELAASILTVGLLHPPLVRHLPITDQYEIISGERRFRASQIAGMVKIPVFVRSTNTSLSAQAALIENLQRVDLNPLEISLALNKIMDEFGFNQDQIAEKIGKKRSTIANYLRLLTLPTVIQRSLSANLITMGHAKAILALDCADKQILLHELILRDQMSVREAEKAAIRISNKARQNQLKHVNRDFFIEHLAEKIQRQIGTKTTIQANGKKGQITLHYYNLDDLDRLLQLLGVNNE